MKSYLAVLVLGLSTLFSFCTKASAQVTVSSIDVVWATVGDDKDWNTQIRERVKLNGEDYASLDCCSAARPDGGNQNDNFRKGSTITGHLVMVKTLQKSDVPNCTFEFGIATVGNDTWEVIPTLVVNYSDGSVDQWTYDLISIGSSGGTFGLGGGGTGYYSVTLAMNGNLSPISASKNEKPPQAARREGRDR